MKKKYHIFIIFILCTLNSCATKLSANISVDKKLNNPVIIDFVFVFDQSVVDELKKVPSMQWFAKRSQYKLDLELNDKIQILSYELVPGQKLEFEKFRPNLNSLALIIYASYLSQGDHRVIIKEYSSVDLNLQKDDFTLTVSPS